MPREHALDVAVQNRRGLATRKGGDCRGRRSPDAGQRFERGAIRGELAIVLAHDNVRCRMKMVRTAVIAESTPQLEDTRKRRVRKGLDIGKRFDESCVIRQHGRDLRLLQHDLRQPDSIGIARVLPWQIVATVLALPRNHATCEIARRRERRRAFTVA